MLGDGGDIGADHRRQVADAALFLRQLLDNEQPARVGHGLEHPGAGFEMVSALAIHAAVPFDIWQYSQIAKNVKSGF